jgi:hypothetical protein
MDAFTPSADTVAKKNAAAIVPPHHHVAGIYLVRYAQECAWREDHRRVDSGRQVMAVSGLALTAPVSVDWCGYWQRGRVSRA